MKTPTVELMPRERGGRDYVKRGGLHLRPGDRVRLKDRNEVCTLDGASEHEHGGVRFKLWLARLGPCGGWVSVIEVDVPIH